MSKKSKNKQHPQPHKDGSGQSGNKFKESLRGGITFGLLHIVIALVIGLGLGGYIGYEFAATRMGGADGMSGPTDAYGRSVTDPHYGHNHP
jgi:hypothetical protein